MGKYTRGLLAVMLAVVLVLPAAAFAMLPEANARSSTGMDGPTMTGKVVDPDTSGRWEIWAAGHSGNKVSTQHVGRIWTDKTVKATEKNEESDFLTTLSAMSSTSNSTVTVTTPLDIVMVLDASGSMDGEMGGGDSTKRIDALESAASSFIDTIAKQNEGIEGVDRQHKVAIVKFAGKKSDNIGNGTYRDGEHTYNYTQVMKGLTDCSGGNVKALKDRIAQITPAGATRADNGLQLAEGITSGRVDAKKIVVFFTDGTPTSFSEFNPDVANAAVTAAKSMKDSKATVYTIGIFDGANPSAGIQDSEKAKKRTSSCRPFRATTPMPRHGMLMVHARKTPTTTSRRPMPKSSRRSSTTFRRPSHRRRLIRPKSIRATTRPSPATSRLPTSWATLCRLMDLPKSSLTARRLPRRARRSIKKPIPTPTSSPARQKTCSSPCSAPAMTIPRRAIS
ncbi:MAG: VWA domain-containing protein [Collinsella sp.]|nr:VWA domain-containing protein [Collinsella sp.]